MQFDIKQIFYLEFKKCISKKYPKKIQFREILGKNVFFLSKINNFL